MCVLGKGDGEVTPHFLELCKTRLCNKKHHYCLLQGEEWERILCSEHLYWIFAFLVQKTNRSPVGSAFVEGFCLFVLPQAIRMSRPFFWWTPGCYNLNPMRMVMLMKEQDVVIQSGQATEVPVLRGWFFPIERARNKGLKFDSKSGKKNHVVVRCWAPSVLRWVCPASGHLHLKSSVEQKDKEAHKDEFWSSC